MLYIEKVIKNLIFHLFGGNGGGVGILHPA